MTNPAWTILIATIGKREQKFLKLLDFLMPQVNKYKGKIQVLAYWNNFESPIGEIRQRLIEEANGDYVSFIDDDDWIADDYCDLIYDKLKTGTDYVGFNVKLTHENLDKEKRIAHHSLSYQGWTQDNEGFYRDVSHLNPIKRSIAKQVKFPSMAAGEDFAWAVSVRSLISTSEDIPALMYEYRHSIIDSTWNGNNNDHARHKRPSVKYKYFQYHSLSKETNK